MATKIKCHTTRIFTVKKIHFLHSVESFKMSNLTLTIAFTPKAGVDRVLQLSNDYEKACKEALGCQHIGLLFDDEISILQESWESSDLFLENYRRVSALFLELMGLVFVLKFDVMGDQNYVENIEVRSILSKYGPKYTSLN